MLNKNKEKIYKQFLRSTAPFRKSERLEVMTEMRKKKPLTKEQKEELEGNKEYFKALEREYKGGTK